MWADSSVLYQIYPLGAFGCPFENDFKKEHRILKMKVWMPKLSDLSIDAILFNPLFQSHTHGYDTIDFYQVDDRLGDTKDLQEIIHSLHDRNIRVIFDTVFNHVGRGFFAFQDVLLNRENSRYKDWFFIDFWNNNEFDDHLSYQNWEGNAILIKLNLKNPEVVEYLCQVVQYWIDTFDVDGLRLDVAYCLDPDFIRTLRARFPSLFIVGETLHGDYNQWVNDSMLDSCTNYECYKGLYSSMNTMNLFEISHSLQRQFGKEPWCLYRGKHLVNFVDNHDVVRIASQLENSHHLPLIYVLLMTMPGIPCLYYGSEWGIEGKKNWNDTELRPEIEHLCSNELTDYIKKLIAIKHEQPSLASAEYDQIILNNTYCVFQREDLYIAINIQGECVEFNLPLEGTFIDLLSEQTGMIDRRLSLDAYEALILKRI